MNHNLIPPPDVTHNTTKFQPMQLKPPQLLGMNSLMDTSQQQQQTQALFKHPPSILKDPKRNQQQHQQQQMQQQQMNHLNLNVNNTFPTLCGDVIITSADGPQNVLIPYDATNSNLNAFNSQFPEMQFSDGHLV
jgi:hypothetical protein